jgi:glycosyltransferase involved in cell wall biosynthesis
MKLTIYIPTYKRPEDLERLLSIIVPQIVDGVEVIVSDNDQNSNFNPMYYPQITYVRRWQNIGCDGNCLAGLSEGSGEYVWVLGDDDIPSNDAVERILGELDGVDRLILTCEKSGKYPAGFKGTIAELYDALEDRSFLVASTLCSMNVWRHEIMDPLLGIKHLDTRNVLAWAGLHCKTIKIADTPTIKVNTTNLTSFPGFSATMNQYIFSLAMVADRFVPDPGMFYNWNYTNAR